jgi:hypothetical protein
MLKGVNKYLLLFWSFVFFTLIPIGIWAQDENIRDIDSVEFSKMDSVSITIYVSFVVDTNGSVIAVKVKEVECDSTLSYKDCDKKLIRQYKKEAIRVVENSEPWKPAKQNGEKVKARFILPIRMKVLRKDILKSN